jgi:hypothetical protein
VTEPTTAPPESSRARVERAALDLFTLRGFENVTSDHVARLEGLLAGTDPAQPVLASVCAAYVEVNDYPDAELPLLRERMQLILTEPALLAHSNLRFAEVDRVVVRHVVARTGAAPSELVPRLVAAGTRAAATTAFEAWLADDTSSLTELLHRAFDEMAAGFPSLRR